MRFASVVVVLSLALAAPAAAQPLPLPAPDAQGAVGPRYEPKIAFYASEVCDWLDVNVDLLNHVIGLLLDDTDDDPEIMTARLAEISARQVVIDALLADARVQDPSFQCIWWDFNPPEEDPAGAEPLGRRLR